LFYAERRPYNGTGQGLDLAEDLEKLPPPRQSGETDGLRKALCNWLIARGLVD
jgi:hypothetical protein